MKNIEGIHCISLNSNDKLATLSKLDLKELLKEIKTYYITYRETLNLPSNVTFGMEIEFEESYLGIIKYLIDKELNKASSKNIWMSKEEGTVMDENKVGGGEVTTPIMTDNRKCWNDFNKAVGILEMCNAKALNKTGAHIHVGAHILSSNEFFNLIKMWMIYEKVIFRFSYGEKVKPRTYIYDYSFPISDKFNFSLFSSKKIEMIKNFYDNDRNRSINLSNIRLNNFNNQTFAPRNTIEIRCPNGTLNPIIWQNNVNFFTKFILSAKNIDQELLQDKIDQYKNHDGNFHLYNHIYLDDALELCDIIFDNNLDKINFLRQYLKDFKTRTNIPSNSKTIKLTK